MGASTMRVYFCRYVTSKISIWAWIKMCESPRSANFALPGNRPCNLWSTRKIPGIFEIPSSDFLGSKLDLCPFPDDLRKSQTGDFPVQFANWFVLPLRADIWSHHWLTEKMGGPQDATGTPWRLPIQGPPYCRKRQQKMAARWARWGQEASPDGWKNQYPLVN